MIVLETPRLALRWLDADDAPFILRLLNEPSWLRFIGDRGVRTLEDAVRYIETGPGAMYRRLGFGLYLVTLRSSGERLGLCGLLKRDTLDDVDLGFAFLPEHWGRGYATEAAAAVLDGDAVRLDLRRVVAITSKDNVASGQVLERLGFRLERLVTLSGDPEELRLFGIDLPRRPVVTPV